MSANGTEMCSLLTFFKNFYNFGKILDNEKGRASALPFSFHLIKKLFLFHLQQQLLAF